MGNCTGCNEGLATLSGEVDVLLIELISFFDRTQGRVQYGVKSRSTDDLEKLAHN